MQMARHAVGILSLLCLSACSIIGTATSVTGTAVGTAMDVTASTVSTTADIITSPVRD